MPALLGKDKTYESRVRQWAARLGYRLMKSRRQIAVDNHGQYMLVRVFRNQVVSGGRFDASLADIEVFLRDEEQRLRR